MAATQEIKDKLFPPKSDFHEVKLLCPFRDKPCVEKECAIYVSDTTTTPHSGHCALRDIGNL